jgi:hypothetical protein
MALTPNYGFRYPVNTDPVDVAGDFNKLATDIDTALLNVDNATTGSIIIARSYNAAPTATISNSTTETDLASMTLPVSTAGDYYNLKIFGSFLNNTGGNRTFTIRYKLGATTLISGTSGNITTNAAARAWTADVNLYIASTSSQVMTSQFTLGGAGLNTIALTAGITVGSPQLGTATEDVTSTKTLVFTGQLGATAATTFTMTTFGYVLTRFIA